MDAGSARSQHLHIHVLRLLMRILRSQHLHIHVLRIRGTAIKPSQVLCALCVLCGPNAHEPFVAFYPALAM